LNLVVTVIYSKGESRVATRSGSRSRGRYILRPARSVRPGLPSPAQPLNDDWQRTRATAPDATLHPLLYHPAKLRCTARPTCAARGARAVVRRSAVAHLPRRALGRRLGHRMRRAYQRWSYGRCERYGRRRRVSRPTPPLHAKGVAVPTGDLRGLGHAKALFEMIVRVGASQLLSPSVGLSACSTVC